MQVARAHVCQVALDKQINYVSTTSAVVVPARMCALLAWWSISIRCVERWHDVCLVTYWLTSQQTAWDAAAQLCVVCYFQRQKNSERLHRQQPCGRSRVRIRDKKYTKSGLREATDGLSFPVVKSEKVNNCELWKLMNNDERICRPTSQK